LKVRFEPIGEEIECGLDETVLDAAFRHGYNLVYGCREGQCSACKCFLLEGEAALKRYSSFALSDSERANGYSLMCRAMPEQDLVVELLHYDPEAYRLEHAIGDGVAVVEALEPLTGDIVRLVLRCASGFQFTPGQYLDLHVPGSENGARRSFSMANLPGDGLIELMVKRYPGGRLSGMLGESIVPGVRLTFTGPYGSLRVGDSRRPVLMIAGGSGMAPILSLLRQLEAERCSRPVRFFYGARTAEDLFHLDEISSLALSDFEFTPVTGRFVHEAVDEFLAGDSGLVDPDVYICGPPPMLEAAEEMLVGRHKLDEQRIFMDKFTTSADAVADPVHGVSEPLDDRAEREFSWFTPTARRASLYEDVTIDTQPSVHRHLTRGWPVSFEDGRGTWDDASTALRCEDWFAFRDPGELWERPFYQAGSTIEHQIEGAMRSAVEDGLIADYGDDWVAFLRRWLQVPAYIEHGLWFALATIARDCLSDSVATCVCLQAAMKQRSAQAVVLYAMDLEQHHGPFPIEDARATFLSDPAWQPARLFLERLAATGDWGEVIVATNVCFEPIVGTMLRREFGIRAAAASGDTVTPVLARVASQEWNWARRWTVSLLSLILGANRDLISEWVATWRPLAVQAASSIATGVGLKVDPEPLVADSEAMLAEAEPVAPARRSRPVVAARSTVATADGAYDYVGIVMAKSAEGDAVAALLARREDIEIRDQPAFWDIRARSRLVIRYAEVSEQLGYEIDAYSIQLEMSTHYGRMVASDDALMLFSDPTEAMEHLMS
jgi:NAD(P)H-flavin reductase/ferredoxin